MRQERIVAECKYISSFKCGTRRVRSDAEQEKLASLERSLSGDVQPVTPGQQQEQEEELVSEEWLHSLKERRKVE